MPQARKFLQTQKDGRYFVTIPPSKTPIYLGTKDRATADQVGAAIYGPWSLKDRATVVRVVKKFKTAIKGDYHHGKETVNRMQLATLDEQTRWLGDNFEQEPEEAFTDTKGKKLYATAIMAQREGLREADEIADRVDRSHIETAATAMLTLAEEERFDLLQELLITVADWAPDEIAADVRDRLTQRFTKAKADTVPDAKERLSDCFDIWKQRSTAKGVSKNHVAAYPKVWKAFIEVVGDIACNKLTKATLIAWQDHVDNSRGTRSSKWHKDQIVPVGAVLKETRKRTDWLPEGILDWVANVFEYKRSSKSKRINRKALSVEAFRALIAKAEEFAAIDVEAYAKANPVKDAIGDNSIKQANRVKRRGLQWAAILRLAVNVGCDRVDICDLTYDDLVLEGDLPLFTRARTKPAEPVERCTPLLPDTVKAIKRWREHQPPIKGKVFSNDAKRPWLRDPLSHSFDSLRDDAGVAGVWFKHCRNVGATLGRKHGRPDHEIEYFLGHEYHGQGAAYTDDLHDDYLLPLVNLIGLAYFDGATLTA